MKQQVKKFRECVLAVFGAEDPTFELPEERWAMAAIYGKEAKYQKRRSYLREIRMNVIHQILDKYGADTVFRKVFNLFHIGKYVSKPIPHLPCTVYSIIFMAYANYIIDICHKLYYNQDESTTQYRDWR